MDDLDVHPLVARLEELFDYGEMTAGCRTAHGSRGSADGQDLDLSVQLERLGDVGQRRGRDLRIARRLALFRHRRNTRRFLRPRQGSRDAEGEQQQCQTSCGAHHAFCGNRSRQSANHAIAPSNAMPTVTSTVSTSSPPPK